MQITVDIEDDILEFARQLASEHGVTADRVIVALLREALTRRQSPPSIAVQASFKPFPRRGVTVTDEFVNCLRDQEGV